VKINAIRIKRHVNATTRDKTRIIYNYIMCVADDAISALCVWRRCGGEREKINRKILEDFHLNCIL
jgi:hypothetical protein